MSESIHVLLVEDSTAHALIARQMLRQDSRFRLTRVERLGEARERLRESRIDVVLLDLMLPDSSGLASITTLARHDPDLPIVVLSGFGGDDPMFAREAVRAGAQDYLPKGATDTGLLCRSLIAAIERKHQEARRIRFAYRDELTGLANRAALEERFESTLARAERRRRALGLVLIEVRLDSELAFHLGPTATDDLLRTLARRLEGQTRRADHLARLGRFRFGTLLESPGAAADLTRLAERYATAIGAPLSLAGEHLALGCSTGIATAPAAPGLELSTLVAASERALADAIAAGGNAICIGGDAPDGTAGPAPATALVTGPLQPVTAAGR